MADIFEVNCNKAELDIKCEYSGSGLSVLVKNPGDILEDCLIDVKFSVPDVDKSYILFPGAVYGGNQADRILEGKYPPRLKNFEDTNPQGPIVIGDIPGWKNGISLQTYDLTMPSCGVYRDLDGNGTIITVDAGPVETPFGFSMDMESITVNFPCIRKSRYRHCGIYEESPDKGLTFDSGETKVFIINIIEDSFNGRAEFSLAMSKANKFNYKERSYNHDELVNNCIEKINREDFDDINGFYMDSGESRRFQAGWVSGLLTAYTMLLTDDPLFHKRAKSTINFVTDKGMAPCGLPFGIYDSKGFRGLKPFDSDGLDFSGTHVRRIYDAVYYMFKIVRLGKIDGNMTENLISKALQSCDTLDKMVNKYGHFGHSIDLQNGDILWGGSAAGITGICCLCEGFKAGGPVAWLDSAEKAGNYYKRFNNMGYFNGGPGDILMAPDSESTYAAMEAFYMLYETTGKEEWKSEFLKASYIMTTWVCMIDFDFPSESSYGRLGLRTTGLVMANTQNKHLGPGVCTASANLFNKALKLSGNEVFNNMFEMIRDAAAEVASFFKGMIPEDINVSDSLCDRGEFYEGHGIWTENAYILMNMEKCDE